MKPAIRVASLSKQYRIGTRRKGEYSTLQETLRGVATAPWRKLNAWRTGVKDSSSADNSLWALKDVDFEIQPGEVIGIIGSNGAGKSTLLKILSQITEPTRGRAELRGRVGSLLEVGTGFHSELTGRENIYLNGAILGMSRREISRKFEEIVGFAGIDKFLDTPVKRYSSGMYVRLAFAVAAHLEPEILLVDEVLAVGDVEFQKKCLGKMKDVGSQGRTILFVSHSIAILQALCQRGIFLQQGKVAVDDTMDRAISAYLKTLERGATEDLAERTDRKGRGQVRLHKIERHVPGDTPSSTLVTGAPARFAFHLSNKIPGLSCVFQIFDERGVAIAAFNSSMHGPGDAQDPNQGPKFICELEELLLPPGRYRMDVDIRANQETQDHVVAAILFDVEEGPIRGRAMRYEGGCRVICLPHRWTTP